MPIVNVLWQHHGREGATWELEATMKAQYPQLFDTSKNFEDDFFFFFEEGNYNTPKLTLVVMHD